MPRPLRFLFLALLLTPVSAPAQQSRRLDDAGRTWTGSGRMTVVR